MASDVSEHKSLSTQVAELPLELRSVSKKLFVDLLNSRFGIVCESTPAKFEGLTFGPDMPDGRWILVISVDNDFRCENPTVFYFLALAPEDSKSGQYGHDAQTVSIRNEPHELSGLRRYAPNERKLQSSSRSCYRSASMKGFLSNCGAKLGRRPCTWANN